jgi:putative glycosyltransferase
VVTSLYRSEPYIQEFHRRIRTVAAEITPDCEFIYVNDGSPDGVLEVALRLRQEDNRVVVVDLSRNFGHHRALMVGLSFATGDLVFMIDVDLEEEPELLRTFYARYRQTEADCVYGVQSGRKGGKFERISGTVFYWLARVLSGTGAPANTLVARLMTRRFVASLLQYQEQEIDITGLLHMTGYWQLPVVAYKHAKPETTYTLMRKFSLALCSLTAFSRRPLIMISVLGGLISLVTLGIMSYYVLVYLFSGTVPSGYTSLILSLWFLGGLTIFCIGVVALYVAVIFSEVKARPRAIVREVYGPGIQGCCRLTTAAPVGHTRGEEARPPRS